MNLRYNVGLLLLPIASSYALIAQEPVSKLLQNHAESIANLKKVCEQKLGAAALETSPYSNDVFFLRYCVDSKEDPVARLESNLDWRSSGRGKTICDAATSAIEKAKSASSWDNNPVLSAAPHSAIISKFLKPSNVITTTSSKNDLVYCIRAGSIDDNNLMSQVSIDQMVEFFLYAKEVNAQVANQRSLETDVLQCVLTCNDLAGVKLVGGSADFRKALSESSTQANTLYPATNGPTLLLNLPGILSALVKLFTPLFPAEVKARLKFVQGPLKDVEDLQQVATSASGAARSKFVQQLDDIVYSP
jgi:CRAL/TRIO domain